MDDSDFLITGAGGQVGKALLKSFPGAKATNSDTLDITDLASLESYDWSDVKVILNAAGYTNVDGAETAKGKAAAWKANTEAVGYMADIAKRRDLLLVHISTAYVFDGSKSVYTEEDQPNPLGEYARSKAAGDQKAEMAPKRYIVRTDSVIGEGKNFVRTMLGLAKNGVSPTVVADQIIRPTFADDLAQAIKFLIDSSAEFGIYNVTNKGQPVSWADFTRAIFKEAGLPTEVHDTTYAEYAATKPQMATRPLSSVLDLTKIESLGFKPPDWRESLAEYVKKEVQ